MPTADKVVGIAMNATTGAGEQVRVLKSGYGTAALPGPVEVLLNGATNDQTFTDTRVLFRDSGGLGGDYQNSESFKNIFDAGAGETWSLQFVTDVNDPATFFSFQHQGTFNQDDRLGIQESADGVTWTNISVPWMQTSNVAKAPWSTGFGGFDGYSGAGAVNGWILPKDVARANELGYVTGTPVNVNSRYLRFWFFNNGSVTAPGWNIELSRVISVDVPVYIDVNDLSRVTMTAGGALIGRTASADASLGSILVQRSAGVDGVTGLSPTEISFLGLDPSLVKEPLAGAQTEFQGTTELYTSGGVIANGQAVVLEYGASTIRAIAPASMPTADKIVGFAMNATTAAGQQVRVLTSGFSTAALPEPVEVLLNGATNGQTVTDTRVLFRDSGGLGGNYQIDGNFLNVFDAGAGETWSLQFVTDVNDPATFFEFEQQGSFMNDRLGIQESTDGVTWTNINVLWMQTSLITTAPWGVLFGGGNGTAFNDESSKNGWILPRDMARANALGYVTGTPVTVNSRYVRFWFDGESGTNKLGWNIELHRVVRVDVPVYIDANDLSRVTVKPGGALVGRTASADSSLDTILVQRTVGDVGTTGLSAPTEISFLGLDPSIVKDPLAGAQTDYQGTTELYTSGGVIANGQAVVLEYGASAIRAIAPASMPSADQVIGIALNATATAGQQVRVLKSGFGSAARLTEFGPGAAVEVKLDGGTNNQTFTDPRVLFRDSGGLVGDYAVGENYKCVFDAGDGGEWSVQFVTDPNDPATFFSFEHLPPNMYDRLGIQTSSDGTTWTNINVPWMQASAETTAPWSTLYRGGDGSENVSARNGWIVPKDVSRANLNGYVTGVPVTFNSRYLRFWFFSDGSTNAPGWNIDLTSSSYVGGPLPVLVDQPVYIDTADLNKVTLTSGGTLIGRTASADASSDSILVRL
jgi:hypothetical protein